eukprot:727631-Prorocentrum_minimum.AAC.1
MVNIDFLPFHDFACRLALTGRDLSPWGWQVGARAAPAGGGREPLRAGGGGIRDGLGGAAGRVQRGRHS